MTLNIGHIIIDNKYNERHLCGRADVVTQEASQSSNLAGEVGQSPVVPKGNRMVNFSCVRSEEDIGEIK